MYTHLYICTPPVIFASYGTNFITKYWLKYKGIPNAKNMFVLTLKSQLNIMKTGRNIFVCRDKRSIRN